MGTLEYLDENCKCFTFDMSVCYTNIWEEERCTLPHVSFLRSWPANIANVSFSLSLLHGLWKSLSRWDFWKNWMKHEEFNSITASLELLNSVLHPMSFCCIHNMWNIKDQQSVTMKCFTTRWSSSQSAPNTSQKNKTKSFLCGSKSIQ